ncbi:unnamed protein product, partial [Thlaspi arvense]
MRDSRLEKLWEGVKADFSDCGGITTMCDELPGPDKASSAFSNISSFSFPDLTVKFNNCFDLDRDAQELILQSDLHYAVLPGAEVPMYFTHKACGSSLSILLSESSLSNFELKACIVVRPPTHPEDRSVHVGVRWYFRGRKGVDPFGMELVSCEMDHLVMHLIRFREEEVHESPSELYNNVLQLEFYYHSYACSYDNFSLNHHSCPFLPRRIKGCGVRVMNISPSPLGRDRSPETEYCQESGESNGESDRSKKRMRMTVTTSQEPSNSLAVNSKLMTPSSELSLGVVGVSTLVSSRSKVPSPSSSFHGDDGALLSLSLSSFDSCEEKSLYFDPMIFEQQGTETPDEDPSLSP